MKSYASLVTFCSLLVPFYLLLVTFCCIDENIHQENAKLSGVTFLVIAHSKYLYKFLLCVTVPITYYKCKVFSEINVLSEIKVINKLLGKLFWKIASLKTSCSEKSVNYRSSRSKMFFKIAVLKNFVIFTEIHLCWSLFLMKLQPWRLVVLQGRVVKHVRLHWSSWRWN